MPNHYPANPDESPRDPNNLPDPEGSEQGERWEVQYSDETGVLNVRALHDDAGMPYPGEVLQPVSQPSARKEHDVAPIQTEAGSTQARPPSVGVRGSESVGAPRDDAHVCADSFNRGEDHSLEGIAQSPEGEGPVMTEAEVRNAPGVATGVIEQLARERASERARADQMRVERDKLADELTAQVDRNVAAEAERDERDEAWRLASLRADEAQANEYKNWERAKAAEAESARLRERVEELEEALRPFAVVGDEWARRVGPLRGMDRTYVYGKHGTEGPKISVADLHRARSALSTPEDQGK